MTVKKEWGKINTHRYIAVVMSYTQVNNNGSEVVENRGRLRESGSSDDWWTISSMDIGDGNAGQHPVFFDGQPLFGKTIEYQVAARNAHGWGPWSTLSTFVAAMKPLKPTSPTLADGTNVGELDVSWTAPHSRGAAITGYDVQYRASSSGTWTEWVHTGTGTTTTITGLQEHLSSSGITYLVRVRATNGQGDSEWSDLAYWPQAIAPLAPSTLTATSGNAAATLRWTSGGDGGAAITGWEVQQAEKQAGSNSYGAYGNWTSIDNSDATTTSTTIYGLTVGSTYKFKLRAVNSVGNGAASAESNAVIPSSATLTASDVTHSSVTLTIGNYSESWYYKHTAPDGGNCRFSVVSGGALSSPAWRGTPTTPSRRTGTAAARRNWRPHPPRS